jgi:hypothetical protein
MVIAQVSGEGEGLDTGSEAADRPPHHSGCGGPGFLAIACEGAAEDAGQQHNQITYLQTLNFSRQKNLAI